MKAIIAVGVVLLILFVTSFNITGNVVGEEENPGFFESIWNFIKGLFGWGESIENESVGASAEVAIKILPSAIENK
jgi:hypothetical protein